MAGEGGKMKGHAVYEEYKDLHHTAGGYEGGACMVRCDYIYEARNSCSYRWQAVKWIKRGGADRHIYKEHKKGLSGTGWRTISASYGAQLFERGALAQEPIASKKKVKVEGQAFRTAFAPYPNQPHHLLPDATLKNGILEVTEPAPQVQDLIIQGLLGCPYNMNHFENVMILPAEERDGCQMGLPTHPNNHYSWDAKVLSKVMEALAPYESVVDAVVQGKKHENPDPQDIKDDLEAISKTLHKELVAPAQRDKIKQKCADGDDITVDSLAEDVATWLGV